MMKVLKILVYAHDGCDGAEVLVTSGGSHPVTLDSDNDNDDDNDSDNDDDDDGTNLDPPVPRAALCQVRNTRPGLDTQRGSQSGHGSGKWVICHVV